MRSYYPRQLPAWFGLVRVRSPLLTESIFLSLPPGTEMFQFPGLARVLPDQSPFDGSPELIAVCHALEPPGAKTSPTRPYELGRTTPNPALQRLLRSLTLPARRSSRGIVGHLASLFLSTIFVLPRPVSECVNAIPGLPAPASTKNTRPPSMTPIKTMVYEAFHDRGSTSFTLLFLLLSSST